MGARASVYSSAAATGQATESADAAPPPEKGPSSPSETARAARRNRDRRRKPRSRSIPNRTPLATADVQTTTFGPGTDALREAPPGRAPEAALPVKMHTHKSVELRCGNGLPDAARGGKARGSASLRTARRRSAPQRTAPPPIEPSAPRTHAGREGVMAASVCLPAADPWQPRQEHAAMPVFLPPVRPVSQLMHLPSHHIQPPTPWIGSAVVPAARPAALHTPLGPSMGAAHTETLWPHRQSLRLSRSADSAPNEEPRRSLSSSNGSCALPSWPPPPPEHREKRVGRGFSNCSSFRGTANLLTGTTAAADSLGEESGALSDCSAATGTTQSGESERVRRGSAISFNQTVSVACDTGEYEAALLQNNAEAPYRCNLPQRVPLTLLESSMPAATSTNSMYRRNGLMFLY